VGPGDLEGFDARSWLRKWTTRPAAALGRKQPHEFEMGICLGEYEASVEVILQQVDESYSTERSPGGLHS